MAYVHKSHILFVLSEKVIKESMFKSNNKIGVDKKKFDV